MPERLSMRQFARLARRWPALLAGLLALSALALLWRVRDTPLMLGALARVDALSALFLFALLGGVALALSAHPDAPASALPRLAAAIGALTLAFSTTLTPAIAAAYLMLALLTIDRFVAAPPAPGKRPARFEKIVPALRNAALSMPGLLAAGCLLLGYGALALSGAVRYDDSTAGLALDSFTFWFVLLAAALACSPLFLVRPDDRRVGESVSEPAGEGTSQVGERSLTRLPIRSLTAFAWLYPLARLYSVGPWNSGWAFATLLLGGAIALWCACSALVRPDRVDRHARVQSLYLGLALAGLGLSTSAGVAATCYGVLAYLVLAVGYGDWGSADQGAEDFSPPPAPNLQYPALDLLPWLISSAVPLTAPFVAAWMLIGASVAGGAALLAGVAWLVALLHGLIVARWDVATPRDARQRLLVAGAASLALGVGAPLFVRALIRPVVAQLQGGLTPYGDVNIWPWVGLAASDSAHTQVTTLPSIAIALLMLVLAALVYVVARLREVRGAGGQGEEAAPPAPVPTLLSQLCDEVPWLGGLLGSNPRGQRQPGDGE